jgi:hypothetical protein
MGPVTVSNLLTQKQLKAIGHRTSAHITNSFHFLPVCMDKHTHEPGIKWVGRANSPRVQQVRSQSRI